MTYAAIITHVQSDPRAAPRLACAVEVARRFNATPIGVAAEAIPPLMFDTGMYGIEGDWVTVMRETIAQRSNEAHERFRAATASLGKSAIWSQGLEFPTWAIAAASRAADLIIAGGAPHKMRDTYRDVSSAELAITAGRPVLVAPPQEWRLQARNIVLGWKDSRESRRALSDALPLLIQADQVVVAEVCHEADAAQAQIQVENVVEGLERHGVRGRPKVIVTPHPTGFDLVEEASNIDADLIVSGAYGHSRLGEWVFGGFTSDLLTQEDMFVLMSH